MVLTIEQAYEPNWLADEIERCVATVAHGGAVIAPPIDIPVGRGCGRRRPVQKPLAIVELSGGRYETTIMAT